MNSIRPAYLKVIFSLQLEPLVVEHVNVGQLTEKPPLVLIVIQFWMPKKVICWSIFVNQFSNIPYCRINEIVF